MFTVEIWYKDIAICCGGKVVSHDGARDQIKSPAR